MNPFHWIPWQFLARRAAKAYGFSDPTAILRRIRQFSRPSEANEPIELLRAGFLFHARGVANTKAIQNNLDWIWPYWIRRQYDPRDPSFVPRAFSFSHINLTQRNWTAVGLPRCDQYAVVDPRGLLMPFHDSWSVDAWILPRDPSVPGLIPSRLERVRQSLTDEGPMTVRTEMEQDGHTLTSTAAMERTDDGAVAIRLDLTADSRHKADLVISLRPYNSEGIRFIDEIAWDASTGSLEVDGRDRLTLPAGAERVLLSDYERGDVTDLVRDDGDDDGEPTRVACPAGMATAAAIFPIAPGDGFAGSCRVTPAPTPPKPPADGGAGVSTWAQHLADTPELSLPDERITRQYRIARRTLALLSPHDIYPGPYTYKRFWFRDACLIAHALLRDGQFATTRRALARFPERQRRDGYFLSQEGEWDSNGQVLWIYDLYERITGREVPDACFNGVSAAVDWIREKRQKAPDKPHDGLFPAGFSAEHFGPNDHYYWDDFWGVAGLRGAAAMLRRRGQPESAGTIDELAGRFLGRIEDSLAGVTARSARGALPASPYRRMDSGAIGSLVADYPLQLWDAADSRVMRTAEFLHDRCTVDHAFFQDMIHSGLNIYLTLDLAQTFLRAGDPRWEALYLRCLELASDTGQWPEAVHPQTLGGCMGDGQHAWAAAEWINLTQNLLVREERDSLVIGSGLLPRWLEAESTPSLRNLPTSHGRLSLVLEPGESGTVDARITFRGEAPENLLVRYALPGYTTTEGRGLFATTLKPEATPEDAS